MDKDIQDIKRRAGITEQELEYDETSNEEHYRQIRADVLYELQLIVDNLGEVVFYANQANMGEELDAYLLGAIDQLNDAYRVAASQNEEIQSLKRRAGITEQGQWMQPSKDSVGFDFRAARKALETLENALVDLSDEAYSLTGKEKEELLKALKLVSPGIQRIKQILSRLT